jgi:hypothetical protein
MTRRLDGEGFVGSAVVGGERSAVGAADSEADGARTPSRGVTGEQKACRRELSRRALPEVPRAQAFALPDGRARNR